MHFLIVHIGGECSFREFAKAHSNFSNRAHWPVVPFIRYLHINCLEERWQIEKDKLFCPNEGID